MPYAAAPQILNRSRAWATAVVRFANSIRAPAWPWRSARVPSVGPRVWT